MQPTDSPVSDAELIALFESGADPPGGFHHREHVRVGWYYLQHHSMPEALVRFGNALRRFAIAHGKPNLYHETITTAFLLLINERLDDGARESTWPEFAQRNVDLLSWKPSILERYYHAATLASDRARRTFVLPDRLAHDP
jgi:hypothetical protein